MKGGGVVMKKENCLRRELYYLRKKGGGCYRFLRRKSRKADLLRATSQSPR